MLANSLLQIERWMELGIITSEKNLCYTCGYPTIEKSFIITKTDMMIGIPGKRPEPRLLRNDPASMSWNNMRVPKDMTDMSTKDRGVVRGNGFSEIIREGFCMCGAFKNPL